MAVERRTDKQKQQQQIVLDYVADGGCDVVGLGDTRLGDDASEVGRMARGVMGRVHDEALTAKLHGPDAQRRAEARAQDGKAIGVSWRSVGSHKDKNDIWRGGVAIGSYGEAALRESSVISDARGWGRYCGRVYQGKGGKRLVVVVVYAPDSTYDEGDTTCGNYSQRL